MSWWYIQTSDGVTLKEVYKRGGGGKECQCFKVGLGFRFLTSRFLQPLSAVAFHCGSANHQGCRMDCTPLQIIVCSSVAALSLDRQR